MAEFHLIRVCGLAVLNIQTRAQMRVRPDRYIPAEAGDATFAILHFYGKFRHSWAAFAGGHRALVGEACRNYLPEISRRRSEANDLTASADMLFFEPLPDQAERSRSASATCRAMPVPSTSSLKSYLGLCSDTRSPALA